MWFNVIILAIAPFVVLHFLGIKNAVWYAIAVIGIIIILGLGFIAGLLFSAMFEPASYWQAYQMPDFWSVSYIRSSTSFGAVFLFPYLLVIDFFRIYLHFNFTNGNVILWCTELITYYIIFNYFVAFNGVSGDMANLFEK